MAASSLQLVKFGQTIFFAQLITIYIQGFSCAFYSKLKYTKEYSLITENNDKTFPYFT